jgi:predicted dehydrogenase
MDHIRIGMIGAGGISTEHLPQIVAHPQARLVCIADTNEALATQSAEKYGALRTCSSYDDLMAMQDIDAVIVGIPTQFHADATIKAAQAGKHVLCEKPMARTLEDCRTMIAAHEQAGTVLAMSFIRRFDPNWGQVRKMDHAGKAGRPCMWRRSHATSTPAVPGSSRQWYSDSKLSDGPLSESGAHDIDFLRYTFGDIAGVTGHVEQLNPFGDVLDNTIVIIQFKSGDSAVIHWSWSLPRGAEAGFNGMDVIGPQGCIHNPRQEDDKWVIDISTGKNLKQTFPFDNEQGPTTMFGGQLADFITSIQRGTPPRATGEDGLRTQEVYAAAIKSMETGRR